jgi:hypothetical protein
MGNYALEQAIAIRANMTSCGTFQDFTTEDLHAFLAYLAAQKKGGTLEFYDASDVVVLVRSIRLRWVTKHV